MSVWLRGLLLVVILTVAAGCRGRPTPIGTFPDAPIVLISIDTLRADHLSVYGYKAGSTPHLDAFAREAIVFEDVYSPVPLTLPAHTSLLTGLLPPRHGVRDNVGFTLTPTHRTLATVLKGRGWRTGAAVSSYVLRRQTGLANGFDFFDDALVIEGETDAVGSIQRDGAATVDALAKWIGAEAGGRFFAFLHLYEPHSPYAPPDRYKGALSPYDGEIAYADELIGRFMERLRSDGLLDRAVVAIVSDHGEGLNDHGEEEHGIFLYRESLNVPFLLRLPGGRRGGARIGGSTSLIDVTATLLDLAGLPLDDIDGASLRARVEGQSAETRPVYSESFYPRYHFGWSELYAATDGRFRYIQAPRAEFYDIERDPKEQRNLGATEAAAPLRAWLNQRVASAGTAPSPAEVSPEVRERLQALGYVGSVSAPNAQGLPDPKDEIGTYEQLKKALALDQQGRHADAAAALDALVTSRPKMLDAWEALGKAQVRAGRLTEAINAFSNVIELDPMKAETHLALARIHALQRRPELARQHAEIAASRNPGEAYQLLAQMLMDQGRLEQAADFARRSIAADDSRFMSYFVLGAVAHAAGRCDEALASYRKADEAKRLQQRTIVRTLHARMADCLVRLGRPADAEREFLAEIDAIPSSREARVGLAMLYRSTGRDQEAGAVLEGLIAAQPHPTADAYFVVVRTFRVLGDTAAAAKWAAQARALFPGDPRFR